MPVKNIIPGQVVSRAKIERARELRRESTPAEQVLWQALRRGQLGGYHFRRQQIIGGYIVDFYCHTGDLIVEVDGEVHLQQQEYDSTRTTFLEGEGFRILRFPNDEVLTNTRRVLDSILKALEDS